MRVRRFVYLLRRRWTDIFSSDGKTYRNYCHLKESSKLAKIEQKPAITVVKRKPCDSGGGEDSESVDRTSSFRLAPEITGPPVSVSNRTGSNVFLTCEVAGVPLPVVEWLYTTAAGKQIVYPSRSLPVSYTHLTLTTILRV